MNETRNGIAVTSRLKIAWLSSSRMSEKKNPEDEAEKDRTDAFHKREKRPGKLKRYSTMTMTEKKNTRTQYGSQI